MVPPLMLAGAGISMSIPGAQNAVVSAVGPSDIGKASGTFTMMRQLGGVFGLAIVVAVFSGAGGYSSPEAFANGFVARDRGVGGVLARGRADRAGDSAACAVGGRTGAGSGMRPRF